jgi:chromosome segregation ATPase
MARQNITLGGLAMIAKITEIDGIIDKLETVIMKLREERDRAVDELAAVKKALDERELELLQMDEETQRAIAGFEDELRVIKQERSEAEQRLESVAVRVRELVSFLPDSAASQAAGDNDVNFSGD